MSHLALRAFAELGLELYLDDLLQADTSDMATFIREAAFRQLFGDVKASEPVETLPAPKAILTTKIVQPLRLAPVPEAQETPVTEIAEALLHDLSAQVIARPDDTDTFAHLETTEARVRAYVLSCIEGQKSIEAQVIYNLTGWEATRIRRIVAAIQDEYAAAKKWGKPEAACRKSRARAGRGRTR